MTYLLFKIPGGIGCEYKNKNKFCEFYHSPASSTSTSGTENITVSKIETCTMFRVGITNTQKCDDCLRCLIHSKRKKHI